MIDAEKYPNFAKLTALLNQQEHPRQALNMMLPLLASKPEGGAQHDAREPD